MTSIILVAFIGAGLGYGGARAMYRRDVAGALAALAGWIALVALTCLPGCRAVWIRDCSVTVSGTGAYISGLGTVDAPKTTDVGVGASTALTGQGTAQSGAASGAVVPPAATGTPTR